VGVFL